MRISILALLSVSCCFSAENTLAPQLEQVMQAFVANREFTGSVLVAKGDTVLLDKGYGLANIEWGIANSPETKFRLGSITKQFTAAAILQLEEQGKLSVSDSACKYVEGCPDAWKAVTIHQLLNHTSGIPDSATPEFFESHKSRIPLTPIQVLMLTRDKPMDFQPGTDWRYDNRGYVFLGVIIEKVSGEKYADYVKAHILNPLGMNATGYDDTVSILKNRASGYVPSASGLVNADYLDMSLPYSAGSLYSTTHDLYRWEQALFGGRVVSQQSLSKMLRPYMKDYGYGLRMQPIAGHRSIGHSGGIPGFATFLALVPEISGVVVVLSNNEGADVTEIRDALAATLLGEKASVPVERKPIMIGASVLDRYTGKYEREGEQIAISRAGGHLVSTQNGQAPIEAFALSPTEFYLRYRQTTLTFVPGPDGTATELQYHRAGQTRTLKRVTSATAR